MCAGTFLAGASGCSNNSEKDIQSLGKTRVLVLGGGPAGVAAAVASARLGVETVLVEEGGCLGGMATRGLVSPFMTCYDKSGEQMIIRGIFGELIDRLVEMGGAIHPSEVRAGTAFTAWIKDGHDHCTPFDAEMLKYLLDRMVTEAGVKPLMHTSFVRPVLKGNRICGAVLLTRNGLAQLDADVVIDATGNADVASRAGVPCVYGNEQSGKAQPATLFCQISNVDHKALEADVEAHLHEFRKVNGVSYRALHWRVAQAEEAGEWDIARKSVNIYRSVRPDVWSVNCSRIHDVDTRSSESMTDAEIEGRRQVQELLNFFRKYVPGCGNVLLKSSAGVIGIRESLHIQGKHILQADDLIEGVVPEDSILLASNSVDVHGGQGGAKGTRYTVIKKNWYGVPWRCLLPQNVEGLIVAGRSLSATSDAAGAVRVIPPVMAMGQAAGVAAALSVKGGTLPGSLDFADIRKALLEGGAFLG